MYGLIYMRRLKLFPFDSTWNVGGRWVYSTIEMRNEVMFLRGVNK